MHSSNSYVATSIIMSQHSFSVASSSWCRDPSFLVATTFLFWFCCNTVLYYCHLGGDPKKSVVTEFCRHLAYFLVAASFLMLRPKFLRYGCFACHNPNMLCRDNTFLPSTRLRVAIGLFCVQLISVLRPEDLCRDIKPPFQLEVCRNIDSPCCNQVSSSIKYPLSRPNFLVAT